jgi:hypothetical protein
MNDIILRHITDRLLQRIEVSVEVKDYFRSVHSRFRRANAIQGIDQCRLARTRSAQNTYKFIRLDRDRNAVKKPDLAPAEFVPYIARQPDRVDAGLRSGIENADISVGVDPDQKRSDLNGVVGPNGLPRNASSIDVNSVGRIEVFDKNFTAAMDQAGVTIGYLQSVELDIASIAANGQLSLSPKPSDIVKLRLGRFP